MTVGLAGARGRWVPGERLVPPSGAASSVADRQGPADGPVVGVLALQGDVLEHLRALARVGARPVQVRRPEHLAAVQGLVLPGGESTTIGTLLVRTGLLDPLRARVAAGMPAFGTCAGMILLADRLDQAVEQPLVGGLGVEVRRNAFGRQVDSFDARLTVDGLVGGPLDVSFIRAPVVTRLLADDVEVLAEVDRGPVVVRRGALLATAFHSEVTGDDRLHALFLEQVRRATV